ncbi:hypothetical protein J3D54_004202 [Pseudomonas sp. GGS8]|uniref:hypothetical protein n=1 Tax=Pseudomonas sp. GGS8 TaxID=2817892 RepID=UPI00209F01AB|nr:hypothetical protein [Pseudomonas sp. GGS8]MCP1445070.1 hypothetical protein [Pseudomonas sp. GGS8]
MFANAMAEFGHTAPGIAEINKQFKEQLSQQLRSVLLLVLKPELAEKLHLS